MDFRQTPIADLARAVRDGELAAREVTRLALERIDALNPALNAFVAVDAERALEQAAAVDQMVATGADPGPLAGIPFGVKDSEDAAGYRTTHGSVLLEKAPVAAHDSAQVARLRAAGAIVVGKTNLPEMAWTSHSTNALFGPTRNPWNLEHTAGGSSGGSAAAIAAGMVPLATGSDGGGSIRIPSACCGLSGAKPSLGRVPSGGPEGPGWPHLSTRGPLARRVDDIVTALDVVVGPDPADLHSLPRPEANWRDGLREPRLPARVAWSPTLGYAAPDSEVTEVCEQALTVIDGLGTEVVEIGPIFEQDPLDDWLTMVGAYLLRTLDELRGEDGWDRVDPLLASVVESARSTTAQELLRAIDQCHRMNLRLVELFHDVRLLITPTLAAPAPPLDLAGAGRVNGEVIANWVQFTYPFNMTRSPAATVAAGLGRSGLPVGLQLIGPQHADAAVLRSAAALEQAIEFDDLAPFGA